MKTRKQIIQYSVLLLLIVLSWRCSNDYEIDQINTVPPENIKANISVKQDNSGEVTITPTGNNANKFFLDFGDGSVKSDTISAGNAFIHIYDEGEYDLKIYGLNIAGQSTVTSQTLKVNFQAPKNLEVTINRDKNNPFKISLSATADLSSGYEVTFGEDPDKKPTLFNEGESIENTYSNVGNYEITVTALSGGKETTTYTTTITITDPFVLPIDFESETVDYAFFNFGGGEGNGVPIVENPDPNSINDSEKVGQFTKVDGAETWGGTSATLNDPVDFSQGSVIEMDVYSAQAGIPVLLKVENADNSDASMEVLQTTTKTNEWETLSFDFSGIDQSVSYTVLSVFFNFDNPGKGKTYYFDNITLTNIHPVTLPLNFEGPEDSYPFQEFNGSPVSIVSNPDSSDGNTSSQVAQFFKVDGAGPYAGAYIDLDEAADFSTQTKITMKVWSPRTDVPMLLKFEDPNDSAVSMEVEGTITEKEKWEEITFDFSNIDPDKNWQRLSLFFDFGNPGTGENYYVDNISLSN